MPGRRSTLRNRLVKFIARSGFWQIWVVPDSDNRSKRLQTLKVGGATADFSSIIAAISAASPGSIIQIAEGRLVASTQNTQAPCVAWLSGLSSTSMSPCLCETFHLRPNA